MKKLLIIIFMSAAIPMYAQDDWQLKKDEDGIKVYTSTVPGSNFKAIKVSCTVNATLSQLIAFLLDVDKQPDWIYSTASSQLIKKISDNELVFYAVVDVPWPATDRDYIAHFTISQKSPQLTTIDSHAEPDLIPKKSGYVRVRQSVAHWDITPQGNGVLQIVYTVHFDPAGSIPAWLTNMFVAKGPYQTFQGLRKGVANPIYKNAHISFIKE